MRRRVIFVDPGLWTQRKEHNTMSASDHRRAAALLAHHRRSDYAGINAVVDEANQAGRGMELVMSVMGTYRGFIPLVRTDAAIELMGRYVEQIATNGVADELDPNLVKAAKLLWAHGIADFATMTDIFMGDRPTDVFVKLLDLYEVLLPELTTPAGVDWLTRQAAAMAGLEGQADQDSGE